MGVPAHDQRDFEFAKKYNLPIPIVIQPQEGELNLEEAYTQDGITVNSGEYDGLHNRVAYGRIVKALEAKGAGKRPVTYRLRDWLISRQRYWGTPIPIVYCDSWNVASK